MNNLCIHRHTVEDHPNCFRPKQWYEKNKSDGSKHKVGYFDLEFSNLKSNFGYLTCFTVKTLGKNEYHTSPITQKEIFNGDFDRRLVSEFIEVITDYDLLIGYYSSCADVPYIKGQAIHYGFEFPKAKTKNHLDIYFAIRGKVATHSKSLKTICQYVGINGKVELTPEEWKQASLGYPDALEKLIKRNRFDCSMLERLHEKFSPYVIFNRNWL